MAGRHGRQVEGGNLGSHRQVGVGKGCTVQVGRLWQVSLFPPPPPPAPPIHNPARTQVGGGRQRNFLGEGVVTAWREKGSSGHQTAMPVLQAGRTEHREQYQAVRSLPPPPPPSSPSSPSCLPNATARRRLASHCLSVWNGGRTGNRETLEGEGWERENCLTPPATVTVGFPLSFSNHTGHTRSEGENVGHAYVCSPSSSLIPKSKSVQKKQKVKVESSGSKNNTWQAGRQGQAYACAGRAKGGKARYKVRHTGARQGGKAQGV